MRFSKDNSEFYVWNNKSIDEALNKTTHLAIAAHQDDVEFMAYHGISECFGSKDKGFSAIIVTNGSGSPRSGIYSDYTDEEMIEIRKIEQKKAAFVGEYSYLAMLMHSSSETKDKNNSLLEDEIYDLLMRTKPEVVYTHNLADKHDTHIAVVVRVIKALRKMPQEIRPKAVYGCEVWRNLDWLRDSDKISLDTSNKPNIAQSVMGVFDSQISGGKNYANATIGRMVANATYISDHAVDEHTHLVFAMDLTPLIKNDNLKITDFVLEHINNFKNDVKNKLKDFE